MKRYSQYVDSLVQLTNSSRTDVDRESKVRAALDGEASRELRRLIGVEQLRQEGAFFTNAELCRFAIEPVTHTIDHNSVIYDPACGAGDLLLACTQALPAGRSLSETLRLWSQRLCATDIHSEFIQAARSRLLLAAWRLHKFSGRQNTLQNKRWFSQFVVQCGLSEIQMYRRATHVLLNPPFTMVCSSKSTPWTSGIVNSAALFLEKALASTNNGTRIIAILPEVLRCGARYEKFRTTIESMARLWRIQSFGLFDNLADVDVFVLDVERQRNRARRQHQHWQWGQPERGARTIQDYFTVAVGPVVDFRDPVDKGRWFRYLTVDNVAPWTRVSGVEKRRRFTGRVFRAPFIVLRRTSRPSDSFRAVGSIVTGSHTFAVDNHLIVCKPKDGLVRTCKSLVRRLKFDSTNDWLNDTICCRHLTVASVRDLPWWEL